MPVTTTSLMTQIQDLLEIPSTNGNAHRSHPCFMSARSLNSDCQSVREIRRTTTMAPPRAAVLLLCLLPIVLSSFVPALDPSLQGNKRRVAFRILQRVEVNERRFGACKDLVLDWEKYDGGFRATFQSHGEQDPVVKNWGFELEFDSPLSEISAFDAVVDETSGSKFVLKDAGYNAVTFEGQFRKFEILGKYDSDVAPKLVSIVQVHGSRRTEIACGKEEEGESTAVEVVDGEEDEVVASKGTKHSFRKWPKKVIEL